VERVAFEAGVRACALAGAAWRARVGLAGTGLSGAGMASGYAGTISLNARWLRRPPAPGMAKPAVA